MDESPGDLVCLLLDTNVLAATSDGAAAAAAKSLLEQVLFFVGSYLAISDRNHLAVYAVQEHSSDLLHLSLGDAMPRAQEFSNPTRNIGTKLVAIAQAVALRRGTSPLSPLALSGALSRALCLVHRLRSKPATQEATLAGAPRLAAQCKPRLLCLVGSPDVAMQYIPVMNAIFSAQRAEVAVDALVLGPPGTDSSFLQQAAHLTGGLYMRAPGCNAAGSAQQPRLLPLKNGGGGHGTHQGDIGAALQYLLSCLSTDSMTRGMLRVHQPLGVDFRASCFCHKRAVDVGYVCSVCLSIFCQQQPQCAICGTAFRSSSAGEEE